MKNHQSKGNLAEVLQVAQEITFIQLLLCVEFNNQGRDMIALYCLMVGIEPGECVIKYLQC